MLSNRLVAVTLAALSHVAAEDVSKAGHGLIGYGISMYEPLCPYSCRTALAYNTLNCSTTIVTDSDGHKQWATTTPDCYATDDSYLTNLAWCINQRCTEMLGWEIEKYWEEGATGDSTSHRRLDETGVSVSIHRPAPKWTYQEALNQVKEPRVMPLFPGSLINGTSVVGDEFFTLQSNTMRTFERNEVSHERYGLIVIILGVALPIAASLLRFLPVPELLRSRLYASIIDPPLFGMRHKEPYFNLGTMPTRGQALFLAYMVVINVILSAVGYHAAQPNAWWDSTHEEILTQVGNRVGVLSFANTPLVILYAGRNNVLYWITGWGQSTFILLHRWTAYICSLQAILHSIIWLQLYLDLGRHASESQLPYWYWGVIGTLAFALLLPASIIPLRQKMFEIFLASHIALTVLALVGSYLHIIYRFEHQWGYELWMYIAFAVWGFDRILRLVRMAWNGLRWAQITIIDDEYMQVDILGAKGNGHAYLYFPTLTFRVWENHPFCIAATVLAPALGENLSIKSSAASSDKDDIQSDEKTMQSTSTELRQQQTQVGLSFFLRSYSGATSFLRRHVRLPVFVEAGYLEPHDCSEYSSLICIVGGVAITTVTSLMRRYPGRAKLYWSCRSPGLVKAVEPTIRNADKHIKIGSRHDIEQVVEREADQGSGAMAVAVSGPASMLDEVRRVVLKTALTSRRPIRLIDEQYIW